MEEEITLKIKGMFCTGCEERIKRTLKSLDGVSYVDVKYSKEEAYITYDKEKVTLQDIENKIVKLDYEVIKYTEKNASKNNFNSIYILVIILAIYIICNHLGLLKVFNIFPTIEMRNELWHDFYCRATYICTLYRNVWWNKSITKCCK